MSRGNEPRHYRLTFHRRRRESIARSYIKHVLTEGKAIAAKSRRRKLYTNNPSDNWLSCKKTEWSHVVFEQPVSFETLAMRPSKKRAIMNDLEKFSQGKECAATGSGRPGSPLGTDKSAMIAATANFLNHDVYYLELTTVKDITELRKLMIETSGKSVTVIEDIDRSLDLAGQRNKNEKKDNHHGDQEADPMKKMAEEEQKSSKVTLSGLLNFIDGIWSACGAERIIAFTTDCIDKLNPALIRRGRMDKPIEMSHCCFKASEVLARNYLDVERRSLFATIARLLEEADMTPADVAENLMPKSDGQDAVEACMRNLIKALEAAAEEARRKAEEDQERKSDGGKEEKEDEISGEVK